MRSPSAVEGGFAGVLKSFTSIRSRNEGGWRASMTGDDRTLNDVFTGWADSQPDAPALVAEGLRPMSYAALVGATAEFRAALNARGFGRGDRIAVIHPGGADMAAALIGLWGAATAVPMNPDLSKAELEAGFRTIRIGALLTDQTPGTPARQAAGRLGIPILELISRGDGVAGSIALQGEGNGTAARPGPSQGEDIATILTTSGTTSHSKIVPIRHRNVLHNYEGYRRGLGLTPADRCLNLMPMFHSHGINPGLGLCLFSGGSTSFLRPFDLATFERVIVSLEPTWYTGAYTFHHQIQAHAERLKAAVARSRLRFARTGSGALDGKIADALERTLNIPVIQSYASTETGSVAINPPPPGRRKPGSVGLPLDPATRVVDETGVPVPTGVNGEVVLRAEAVFDGYENDPAANAEAFRDGWYRTGDRGYFDTDGYLFLTGRIKELINRGGEKIAPFEVEAALQAYPGVSAAVVFPIPHPTLGQEVGAAIVPAPGAALEARAIAAWLRSSLADFKIPRRYAFVDAIPKSATGRVVRRQLASELGLDAPPAAGTNRSGAPRRFPTALEAQLQDIWSATLGLDTVGLGEHFYDLGGDSLKAVELFLQIEAALGCRLPSAILFEAATVEAMARRIAEYSGSPCLVAVNPTGDKPPIFMIHGGDGNAVYFRNLARYLGPSQPFYALQCVGLDGREQPLTRIEDIVARYLPEIRAVQPHGPYYLAGFSFGGRVAYVLAQRLRAAGEAVALLAMLDTYAVAGEDFLGLWPALRYRMREMQRVSPRALRGYVTQRARNTLRVMAMRSPPALFGLMRRRFGDATPAVPHSLRLSPLEAHAMANRAFRPTPYDGDLVLFRAVENRADRHDGWEKLVKGCFQVCEVPGGHTDILAEPRVQVLARELARVLAETQARHGHPIGTSKRDAKGKALADRGTDIPAAV